MESSKLNFQQYLNLPKAEQDAYFSTLTIDQIMELALDGIRTIDNGWTEVFETVEESFEKRLQNDTASKKEMDSLLTRVMK